jgi:hypothetical protein
MLPLQIAGLAATGWLIWSQSIAPRLLSRSWSALAGEALKHALLAGIAGAGITLALYWAAGVLWHPGVIRHAAETSSTAVWFAPATILLAIHSPATIAAALVLVVSTTRLLFSQWRTLTDRETPVFPVHNLFQVQAATLSLREFAPSFASGLAAQSGVTALLFGRPLAAALWICLGAALLTLLAQLSGLFAPRQPQSLPRSALGWVLTVLLAAGLTTAGAGFAGVTDGLGGARGTGNDGRIPVYVEPVPAAEVRLADGGFPGVILWPEIKPETTLVAPLPSWVTLRTSTTRRTPATIIFSGQYWMFRRPFNRPPAQSYFQRASPLRASFISLNHVPLQMEAHQKLDHAIDMGCCGAIQVEISNGDLYASSVALELVLLDESPQGTRSQSLGTIGVRSEPEPVRRGEVHPARELLTFAVPANGAVRTFDAVEVVFHFALVRNDRSARISLERFILVPRG